MTLFVHLLQILAGLFIVYVGLAIVVSLAVLAFGVWLFKRRRTVIGHHWGPVVLLAALLVPTLHGSTVHVSRKQYVREVSAIVSQYDQEVAAYAKNPPNGVMDAAVSEYVTRAEWDIGLVAMQLDYYKRHRNAAQQDVETVLSQLSRDVEDTPEPITSRTDLQN